MTAIPLSFEGEPPDLRDGDELLPPDELAVHGYVRFERVAPHRVSMRCVRVEDRWRHPGLLHQLERPAQGGGYLLRTVAPGGVHTISIQALRRIRGHGRTVRPSEAFGLLIGWPARHVLHAALPVGRTRVYHVRTDLFQGIEAALPLAARLAEERGLAVMGLYCAVREPDHWDIAGRVPTALGDGCLLIVPDYGCVWGPRCLSRASPPHGWLECPWRLGLSPIPEASLNPRRMHTAWLSAFGPIDYGRCEWPVEARRPPVLPASEPRHDWFSSERQILGPAAVPDAWQWLSEAIVTGREVRIRYGGGSQPGAERLLRPAALFTVSGYEAVYLQAVDVELDEERVFRLDRVVRVDNGISQSASV